MSNDASLSLPETPVIHHMTDERLAENFACVTQTSAGQRTLQSRANAIEPYAVSRGTSGFASALTCLAAACGGVTFIWSDINDWFLFFDSRRCPE
jgi:hypothetical protein